MRNIILCVLWIALPALANAAEDSVVQKVRLEEKPIVVASSQPLVLRVVPSADASVIDRIEVLSPAKSDLVQTIRISDMEAPPRQRTYWKVFRFSQESAHRFGVLTNWGATGNMIWKFWAWDPLTNQFVHDPILSAFPTPVIDPKGWVYTSSKGTGCEYRREKYRLRQGTWHRTETIQAFSGKTPDACVCTRQAWNMANTAAVTVDCETAFNRYPWVDSRGKP